MQTYILKLIYLLQLLYLMLLSTPVNAGDNTPPTFQELLSEAGLELSIPEGFDEITLETNPLLQHEKALRHQDGKLELRYVIRPLGRIEIDYEDPHSAVPEPNHMFNIR